VIWPEKLDLFGVQVTPTSYDEAGEIIVAAAEQGHSAVVSCHAVHAVATASCDRSLRDKVNRFDMITPDGQPVRWALNLLHRTGLSERVTGRGITDAVCQRAAERGVGVYLYGGSPEVVVKFRNDLKRRFPQLHVAGYESPPYRALTPEEDRAVVDRINSSGARIVFIGLGFPKQDVFAWEHHDKLEAIQVCVGAVFDFYAGVKKCAPLWMQRHGLEWCYRLMQEPRRLWRRYLVTNTLFLAKLGAALCVRTLRPPKKRATLGVNEGYM
jgi:exopolysaccharide biosynthesis WecB/TagA/CpsF family protein